MDENCFFCDIRNPEKHEILAENESSYARVDHFPVSPGHAEIVPKRHVISPFDLEQKEILEMFDLLKQTKQSLDKKYHPQGYNIGINEGAAAGQTIPHLHIHIIPRYEGDVPNPRGGIRNIIPGKGDYTKLQ